MPQPLSFIKLRDAEYVDQFAGSVVPELKDAQKVLNERYDLAEENDSKRAAIAREMMQNVADKDKGQAQLAYKRAMDDIEANKARGDYENMYGKTANSARQFSVNAAKFVKEKQLMDAAWKDLSARKDISESEKQKIWDNNVMLANKPLTFNERENVVEGEHFRPVNIAANIDALKTFTGYAEKMKADIDAGENERYGYFTPDGKRAKSTDAGAMLFHTTNGWKRERVTESEIEKMTMDVAEADPTFKDYTNRKIVQETGLLFRKIDEDPTLSPQEKQLQKADYIQKVKNNIKITEYDPATRAVKNIFGYHNNADVNRLKGDAITVLDLKSKNTPPPPPPAAGTTMPTEASDNPHAVKEEDLEPSKYFKSYVKDTQGNVIKSKAEIESNLLNQLSDPETLGKLLPVFKNSWKSMIEATVNDPDKRKEYLQTIAKELAGDAVNVNDASWYEALDQYDNSNIRGRLSAFGLNPVPYTEKEKTTDNTNEFFGNVVNKNLTKPEYAEYVEGGNPSAELNQVLTEIGIDIDKGGKAKDKSTREKLVKETYNKLYKTALPSIAKVMVSGDTRSDFTNKPLKDMTYNNREGSVWFMEHEGKTEQFSNFTALQNFLIEKGLHKEGKTIGPDQFNIAYTRMASPRGSSGDVGVKIITSEGKDKTIYGKGGDMYRKLTRPLNEIYENSFLKGKDVYDSPDNFKTIQTANDGIGPIDYFTNTVVNKHFNKNTPDSKPFNTFVFYRPTGVDAKFKKISLEDFTNIEKAAIQYRLSPSTSNQNPTTKKEADQLLNYGQNPYSTQEDNLEEEDNEPLPN